MSSVLLCRHRRFTSGVFAQARKIIVLRDCITHQLESRHVGFVKSHAPNGSEDASNVFTFMTIMVIIPCILYTLLVDYQILHVVY